ncbi:MAG TPA: hypothetical protein VGM86_32665, partial [Thermoanaerobaculia bacterium]
LGGKAREGEGGEQDESEENTVGSGFRRHDRLLSGAGLGRGGMPAEPVSPIEKVASDGKIALDLRKVHPKPAP